jgi:hypothetical protein
MSGSGMPETPEGIAFVLWVASRGAAHEPGNTLRAVALLDLFGECLKAAEGERKPQHERGLVQ